MNDMVKHLLEEEQFYLKERAFNRELTRNTKGIKDEAEKCEHECNSILMSIKNQIKENHGRD